MSGDAEWKVSGSGQVIQAPANIPIKNRGPKKIAGSKPRNWESRKPGECCAIVQTICKPGEWPEHLACCLPADPNIRGSWCTDHDPFIPVGSIRELTRSLRKHL